MRTGYHFAVKKKALPENKPKNSVLTKQRLVEV